MNTTGRAVKQALAIIIFVSWQRTRGVMGKAGGSNLIGHHGDSDDYHYLLIGYLCLGGQDRNSHSFVLSRSIFLVLTLSLSLSLSLLSISALARP